MFTSRTASKDFLFLCPLSQSPTQSVVPPKNLSFIYQFNVGSAPVTGWLESGQPWGRDPQLPFGWPGPTGRTLFSLRKE